MGRTSIEWTDHSINPIRAKIGENIGHYCEKISPGCKNCYSSRMQRRFKMPSFPEQRRTIPHVFLDESKLEEVLRRRKPTRYFWCDMTDLFGEWVLDEWIDQCFATMAVTPEHTHMILTKRPERALEWYARDWSTCVRCLEVIKDGDTFWTTRTIGYRWPLRNVWLGTSVENRAALGRIDILRETPAALRFLSLEPLLEDLGTLDLRGIHWVIVGGESGPGARPMEEDWVRSIHDQCVQAGIPFFYKQRVEQGRKISLPKLDGRQWAEMPV